MDRTPPLLRFVIEILSSLFLFAVIAVAGYGFSLVSKFLGHASANATIVTIFTWSSKLIFLAAFIFLALALVGTVFNLLEAVRGKQGGNHG